MGARLERALRRGSSKRAQWPPRGAAAAAAARERAPGRAAPVARARTLLAVASLLSMSTLTKVTPAVAAASAANLGPMARHGPHHAAV